MPLHRVYPVLVVKQTVDRTLLEGILDRTVHVVPAVVLPDGPVENPVGVFGKHGSQSLFYVAIFSGKSYLCPKRLNKVNEYFQKSNIPRGNPALLPARSAAGAGAPDARRVHRPLQTYRRGADGTLRHPGEHHHGPGHSRIGLR